MQFPTCFSPAINCLRKRIGQRLYEGKWSLNKDGWPTLLLTINCELSIKVKLTPKSGAELLWHDVDFLHALYLGDYNRIIRKATNFYSIQVDLLKIFEDSEITNLEFRGSHQQSYYHMDGLECRRYLSSLMISH